MEKKLLLLIGVVLVISIISSFFAGTIIGVAPLRIAGVDYSLCPRWKCTYFKSSTTQQLLNLNSSTTFNGYTFLLLDVLSSVAKIQIRGQDTLDTFWVRINETHYTLGGVIGLASYTPNETTGVSYKGYTVYVLDGETNKWAYIVVKDNLGRTVWSEVMEKNQISTIYISNTTIIKIKLIDVTTSSLTGSVYARLIVGDTDIYTTFLDGQYKSWALIKISMYYPATSYVCSFDNPGNCVVYGSCRYCPI
ncbi:MAG: hypothetical protein ACP5O8_02815 [Candidatus Aenigmatarchaeota archaeon]